MQQLRARFTYANVISTLALFIALGGATAFAATQLPKNSVGSPQIKKNAVNTGDIARNAVRVGKLAPEAAKAGKIAKNAITTNRLRDNAVTGAKVNEATLGKVPSAAAADGAATANLAVDSQRLGGLSSTQVIDASKSRCPTGTTLIGGACFETALRGPATYGTALQTCGKAGRFMPTYSQAYTYQWQTNATLPPNKEWRGEYHPKEDGTVRAFAGVVAQNGSASGGIHAITESFHYRCVVFPTG